GSGQREDMSTFSFHPVKTIAMGEGGAITLNDTELANKMRLLRSHAMEHDPARGSWFYEMGELGYNYRATDIQCALGLSQLKKLERFVEKRKKLAKLYDEFLEPLAPHILPPSRVGGQDPALHLYAARFDFEKIGKSRDDVMLALKEKSIGTQVHYIPVHSQPYYQKLYGKQSLPGAAEYYQKTLSLPLFPLMEEDDVRYVVQAVSEVCGL
ncbi:MAG: DegT/DnrJ/EryC1/StrS family aminotransferase, partial [Alphaproteobacteria bacterium]|nr:DegT/DnrJ/EryC1/StrS family aminotransferase [Alphaproteobacteria bacterium]